MSSADTYNRSRNDLDYITGDGQQPVGQPGPQTGQGRRRQPETLDRNGQSFADAGESSPMQGKEEPLRGFIPTWDNKPQEVSPVVSINGIPILRRGNIGLITAQMGVGKSAVCEAIAAARLSPTRRDTVVDTFGIEVTTDKAILYLDTERSSGDHWNSWERVNRRAGVKQGEALNDVQFEDLKMIGSLKDRRGLLRQRIESREYGLIILDGIADFVRDVNDLAECQEFVTELTANAERYDLSIIATLHENPSAINSDKPRGHLGSELLRRAECALSLQRDPSGVRTLTMNGRYGKNRNAIDTVETCFRWDDSHKMFVLCEPPTGKAAKKRDQLTDLVAEVFKEQSEFNHTALVDRIRAVTGKSDDTAKRRIKSMLDARLIVKDETGSYRRFYAD